MGRTCFLDPCPDLKAGTGHEMTRLIEVKFPGEKTQKTFSFLYLGVLKCWWCRKLPWKHIMDQSNHHLCLTEGSWGVNDKYVLLEILTNFSCDTLCMVWLTFWVVITSIRVCYNMTGFPLHHSMSIHFMHMTAMRVVITRAEWLLHHCSDSAYEEISSINPCHPMDKPFRAADSRDGVWK